MLLFLNIQMFLSASPRRPARQQVLGLKVLFASVVVLAAFFTAAPILRAQDVEQLFVSSFGNNQVLDYNAKNGAFINTFVQGTSSDQLDGPLSVTFGPDGNLYVASFATDQVLRYNGTTGAFIDAFVTAGDGGLDQPIALVFGPDGDLYVASEGTQQVLRYDGTTGAFDSVFVAAGSGGLAEPVGLSFGPDDNLYVSDVINNQVLRYNGTTGAFIDVFVTTGSGGLADPTGVGFGPDNNLYVTARGSEQVLRYNGTTGAFIDIFVTTGSGGLDQPEGFSFGPDGNFYLSSRGTDQVLQYNGTTGAFIGIFVTARSGGLDDPFGLVFGPDDNLYVASFGTDQVIQYNGSTGAFIKVFASTDNAGLDQPEGLVFGPDGNLYVASRGTDEVLRYDGITGVLIDAFVPSGGGGLDNPRDLVFGADGNLYVSSSGNDSVLQYNGTTGAFLGAFVPSGSGGLDDPFGLLFGPDGNLYVASRGTDEVLRYNGATGAFIDAFVSAGSGGLDLAWGLAFGPDGNLYVTSRGSNQVLRYNGATGAFIDVFVDAGSGGLTGPFCIDFGLDHNLYLCSFGSDEVLRYNGTSGAFIDAFVSAGSGGLDGPTGIAFRKLIELSKTVLLATNGINLKKESNIYSGNTVDNAGDGTIKVDKKATTSAGYDMIADRIDIKKDATVGSHVTYNSLKNKGNITGNETEGADLPVFQNLPPFQSAPAGSQKVTVAKDGEETIGPGDYGKLVAKKGGRLVFTGGTYNVASIDAKKNASLLFEAASEIRVEKNIKTGQGTFVGASEGSGVSAADIVFYVAGKKVNLGKRSNVHANFYAPDGKVTLKKDAEATGGFIGQNLQIDKGSTVKLNSFVPSACPLNYNFPADIDVTLPNTGVQGNLDEYSWRTFLALNAPTVGGQINRNGDNPTQWQQWSSTTDLIQCNRLNGAASSACTCPDNDCSQSGARYYPEPCREIEGFTNYRALAQLSKVDDSFLEAAVGTLSNSALLDSKGNFVRYEIMVSPATYDFVVDNQLYQPSVVNSLSEDLIFPCGEVSYKGGNPADPRMGSIAIKNAWMELAGRDPSTYHTEELLVFAPADRNITGEATCELKTMALVGMHIDHKTTKQPNWTWSTFEHKLNAPDCTALPGSGDQQGDNGPSQACPTSVPFDYNFYAQSCSKNGDPEACQTCNVTPLSNAPDPTQDCLNKTVDHPDDTGWCLDLPPASEKGLSKVCLQVPIKKNYPDAHALNSACAISIGFDSVWSNYELASTQWYDAASTQCQNGKTFSDRSLIKPQVDVSGDGSDTRPFLGNSSMETYVRSNCTGCHAAAQTKEKISTDGMWWIVLEGADPSTP